jgi:hypothetical protein
VPERARDRCPVALGFAKQKTQHDDEQSQDDYKGEGEQTVALRPYASTHLPNATVTGDALNHDQPQAQAVLDAGGDYFFQLKNEHRHAYQATVQKAQATLASHPQCALARLSARQSSVSLCPQDTTTLHDTAHPATQGLAQVGAQPGQSLGLLPHSTRTLSPPGDWFGLLHAHCWAGPKRKKSRRARSRPDKKISEKETCRWLDGFRQVERLAQLEPHPQWVSVNDREGDIYEALQAATAPGHRAGLQPAAPADRWLSTAQWQALSSDGHRTQHVPEHPPTIGQAVRWMAQLGGILARQRDGHPGPRTLWRGLQRLSDIVGSWQAFGPRGRPRQRSKPCRQQTQQEVGNAPV